MGFAGQVFAARVAIGLAVPSPKALSKTGSVLAQGIKGIHKRIQMAAQESTLTDKYRKNLAKLNTLTTTNTQRTANFVATKLEQNLDRMSKRTIRNMKLVYDTNSKEYRNLEKEMNKPFGKRSIDTTFMSGHKMMNLAQKARQMASFNQKQRNEEIRHQASVAANAQRLLDAERARLNLENQGKILSEDEHRLQHLHLQDLEKNVKTEKERLSVLRSIDGEIKDINAEMQSIDAEGWDIAGKFTEAANVIRDTFNNALRNSVALLTAFGFQLHRAGQSIVDFERELINANSVFNLTHDNLFTIGNEIMKFGNKYGIAVQNGAEGMYQLASAGVTANEAMSILPETLKLSMAVQGDHNTISKLTAQTLFGFGMEMDQAAEVTDKFAFAIQKSLIEYQDLASAVKFALPFFTSTGQSIDQLLGALQILTNRALEAGIAGRGLRQALAEFAESAMDAEVGFRKMGVEILNAEGEMKQLTEIAAQFKEAVGPDTASNTELLTTLIEDLNVRGATAFIHLVQASDEFTQAVKDTEQAGGQLDAMIEEQNKSLSAQIQILKTNVLSIFAFRDAAYEGTGYLNAFHESLVKGVEQFRDLIIEGEGAEMQLTKTGQAIQDLAVDGVEVFIEIGMRFIDLIEQIAESNYDWKGTLELLTVPLETLATILSWMNEKGILEFYLQMKVINSIIPVTTALAWGMSAAFKSVAMWQAASAFNKQAGSLGMKTVGMGLPKMMGLAAFGVPALALGAGYLLYKHANKDKEKAAGGYLNPMAQGGFPRGGTPYLVGEQGPELFMPDVGGKLLNNGATQNTMGSGMKLNNVTIGIDSFGGLV